MTPLQATLPPKPRSIFSSLRSRLTGITIALGAVAIGVIGYYDVDKTITAEDRQYMQAFIPAGVPEHAAELPYAQQLQALQQVQRHLMQTIELGDGIPVGVATEPKDLFKSQKGLCYNRSRVLEKVYMHLGFTTRHVYVYVDVAGKSLTQEVFSPGSPSHAILEVKTAKGWLTVDSNVPWMALDRDQYPHPMEQIKEAKGNIEWASAYPKGWEQYYDGSAFHVYGLYSRHGQFYPPFTRGIPDYNLRELAYNI